MNKIRCDCFKNFQCEAWLSTNLNTTSNESMRYLDFLWFSMIFLFVCLLVGWLVCLHVCSFVGLVWFGLVWFVCVFVCLFVSIGCYHVQNSVPLLFQNPPNLYHRTFRRWRGKSVWCHRIPWRIHGTRTYIHLHEWLFFDGKCTPWKINMEPTNHPFRKENDLNQTSMRTCSSR